jgi:hypothetical protein
MGKTIESISFDVVADVLAASERRKLLVALTEHNPQNELAVADDATGDAHERLVMMRHVHLPKLAEHDLVDWDERSHEVTRGPAFDEIEPVLTLLTDNEGDLPADWP